MAPGRKSSFMLLGGCPFLGGLLPLFLAVLFPYTPLLLMYCVVFFVFSLRCSHGHNLST